MSDLTRKQASILSLLATPFHNGTATEGELIDFLWPLVRQPRRSVRALEAKGLVTFGDHIDDEWGYALHLTDAGREAVARGNTPEEPNA